MKVQSIQNKWLKVCWLTILLFFGIACELFSVEESVIPGYQFFVSEAQYVTCPMWGEFTPCIGPLMCTDLFGLCSCENKKIKQAFLYEPTQVCLAREGCGLYVGFSY